MVDPPPPPPGGPDDDNPEKEEELFELFRHLRERVFVASSELVSHVMRELEAQVETAPRDSFATTIVVQMINWVTSLLDPDAREDGDTDARKDGGSEGGQRTTGRDDEPTHGDDER